MVREAGVRSPIPAFLYVYVGNTEAVYERALKAGARAIESPFDTPDGDRRCMVEDQWGNVWQVATTAGATMPPNPSIRGRPLAAAPNVRR